MKKGILIYAHNNTSVDYALMSIISGGLAKKNLKVPASLVTDQHTISWMKESKIYDLANTVFENIIEVEKPQTANKRRLFDGNQDSMVPFVNANRYSAWELTPYDRTLLIDCDFLVMSSNLSQYWDVDFDYMIGESINDIYDQKRLGYHDRFISDVGIKLYWATTIMFTKNQKSKLFFDLVQCIKDNYQYFADIYRFDSRQYRNDISFSIAKHILDGFEEDKSQQLPPVLSALDRDILHSVAGSRLTFLITPKLDETYCAASVSELDIHVMNKQSIVRNKEKLLELI